MLEHLQVNVDSGHSRFDWGRPQVEQAGSAGADQNDPPLDLFLRDFARQYLPGGNIGRLIEAAEFEIHASSSIGRDFDVADAHVVEARGLSKRRLTTRV